MRENNPASGDDEVHPADILINIIAAFLAPMFLGAGNTSVALARAAALETVACYRAQNQADMLIIAQIVACGFGMLASISLSLMDGMPMTAITRLQTNAIAFNRAGERLTTSRNRMKRDSEQHAKEEQAWQEQESRREQEALTAAAAAREAERLIQEAEAAIAEQHAAPTEAAITTASPVSASPVAAAPVAAAPLAAAPLVAMSPAIAKDAINTAPDDKSPSVNATQRPPDAAPGAVAQSPGGILDKDDMQTTGTMRAKLEGLLNIRRP